MQAYSFTGTERQFILKLMNRKYTREWYLERVAAIRRIIPDCGLSTDIFSGYHSETEEDHQESLSLMRECAYDSAFMFKYSERPGTYASKHLPDDVPEEVKIRRLNEIIELQNRLSAESNARDVGKTFEVMVEGVSKRSREQLFGRTQQNKVVVFDRGNHRIGDFVHVRITEASSATLKGEEVFGWGEKKNIRKRTCNICKFFLHRKVFVLYLVICFIKYCRQVRVQFHLQSEVLSPFIIGEV